MNVLQRLRLPLRERHRRLGQARVQGLVLEVQDHVEEIGQEVVALLGQRQVLVQQQDPLIHVPVRALVRATVQQLLVGNVLDRHRVIERQLDTARDLH